MSRLLLTSELQAPEATFTYVHYIASIDLMRLSNLSLSRS